MFKRGKGHVLTPSRLAEDRFGRHFEKDTQHTPKISLCLFPSWSRQKVSEHPGRDFQSGVIRFLSATPHHVGFRVYGLVLGHSCAVDCWFRFRRMTFLVFVRRIVVTISVCRMNNHACTEGTSAPLPAHSERDKWPCT